MVRAEPDPRYRALLIANGTYPDDPNNLVPLRGPANDVDHLQQALSHPTVGMFLPENVQVVREQPIVEVLPIVEEFLTQASSGQTLLLYYSGHGRLDQRGELFLCHYSSRCDRLWSTALKASDVRAMIDRSPATTIVLLDCCHGGRFKDGASPGMLAAEGSFVIMGSRAGELADDAVDDASMSIFTRHLVDGLLFGAVDRDNDERITLNDLYAYVREALAPTGRQMPQKHFRGNSDPVIGRRTPSPAPQRNGTLLDVSIGVPPRNPHFCGRDAYINLIERTFRREQTNGEPEPRSIGLHAVQGSGKTQITLEYVHRHGYAYDLLVWIDAEQRPLVLRALADLAEQLGLAPADNQERMADRALGWLRSVQSPVRWLVVLDNAVEPADVRTFWPSGPQGDVLVTSTNQEIGSLVETLLEVAPMDQTEAVTFLEARTETEAVPETAAIADFLGGFPLALEQAGAYIRSTGIGYASYLGLLETQLVDLMRRGKPPGYRQLVIRPQEQPSDTATSAWQLSIDRAVAEAPACLELLHRLSMLAPDDIPLDLLLAEPTLSVELSPLDCLDAVGALAKYGILRTDAGRTTASMHRLVQTVTRLTLDPDQAIKTCRDVVRMMLRSLPDDVGDSLTWPRCEQLLSHALILMRYADELEQEQRRMFCPRERARLLETVLAYFRARGQLRLAGELLDTAELGRHGELDPAIRATVFRAKGIVLRESGRLADAVDAFSRALDLDEASTPPDPLACADDCRELGWTLRETGDRKGARSVLLRAVELDERHGAAPHVVAAGLRALGAAHCETDDFESGRQALERALELDQRSTAAEAWAIGEDLRWLAVAQRGIGELDAAYDAISKALRVHEELLGGRHWRVAENLRVLATVLYQQGEFAAAEERLKRALAVHEHELGEMSWRVAEDLLWLGRVKERRGQPEEAARIFRRGCHITEGTLGESHWRSRLLQSERDRIDAGEPEG